jgi:perosamine synthetase
MIPIAKPVIGDEEKNAVIRVLESGILAHGPEVDRFEEEFASYIGTKHAAALTNGTAAIHLALAAMGVGPGDEVVTTAFSFIASATPILYLGAKPCFADIDPRTFNMDPVSLKKAITPRTKAVIPVHLYGQSADMDAIMEVAGDIPVLEDCAQSHGAIFNGRKVGTFGRCGMFSFYPTKNMTSGEGGMVVSDDREFIERIKLLRNHGQIAQYDHRAIGFNLRLTSIGAAIGREQLKKLDDFNRTRMTNAHTLDEGLSGIEGLETPYVDPRAKHVYHQYTIRLSRDRDGFAKRLMENGIDNKVYYPTTIASSPVMKGYVERTFPVAEKTCKEVLSIPVHPMVSQTDLDTIIDGVKRSMR